MREDVAEAPVSALELPGRAALTGRFGIAGHLDPGTCVTGFRLAAPFVHPVVWMARVVYATRLFMPPRRVGATGDFLAEDTFSVQGSVAGDSRKRQLADLALGRVRRGPGS